MVYYSLHSLHSGQQKGGISGVGMNSLFQYPVNCSSDGRYFYHIFPESCALPTRMLNRWLKGYVDLVYQISQALWIEDLECNPPFLAGSLVDHHSFQLPFNELLSRTIGQILLLTSSTIAVPLPTWVRWFLDFISFSLLFSFLIFLKNILEQLPQQSS